VQALIFGVLLKLFQSKPVQDKLAEWKTEFFDWVKAIIKDELTTWIPIFVKTIVASVAQSAGQFVVNTEDKITDIIPGDVDDKILDPIVTNTLDRLGDLIGIKLR
jgi:hypothetical protein